MCLRRPTFVCQQQKWATLLKPDDFQSKCLSAHFAISDNTPLRSVLVKFEAEPNFFKIKNGSKEPKNFSFVRDKVHAISLASCSSQSENIYLYDGERAYASELRIQYSCMKYRTLLAEIGMPGRGLFSLDFSSLIVGKVESGVWGRSTPNRKK